MYFVQLYQRFFADFSMLIVVSYALGTWKHNFVNVIGMTHEYGILEGLSSEVVILLAVVLYYIGLFSIVF